MHAFSDNNDDNSNNINNNNNNNNENGDNAFILRHLHNCPITHCNEQTTRYQMI